MRRIKVISVTALFALIWHDMAVVAQMPAPSPAATDVHVEQHLQELNDKLDALRSQLTESLTEMQQLRAEVRSLRQELGEKTQAEAASQDAEKLRDSVTQLQETAEVLQAEVKQHDQIKVETASKFPLRISGTLLLTSFLNSGNVDDFDLPVVALPRQPHAPSGSLSATVTQTLFGLDATGPHVWGGRTFADLSVDFWGGSSSNGYYSPASGTLRLRTAHARLEWPRQSIGIALDRPLFSPVQPNSWLTVAEPAFAWSGNLWSWLPQISYRRSLAPGHWLDLEAGVLDTAAPSNYDNNGQPVPNASERSRQPGYEARVSSGSLWREAPFTIGASGYYSRKSFTNSRHLDAWAAAADWSVPLANPLVLSGQVYRGRAIGGLGGGAFKDYLSSYGENYGLNAEGGWAQLTLTASHAVQANVGFGMDNPFAKDLEAADLTNPQTIYYSLARNQTVLANVIFRPKSYLLLSAEFRQINSRTTSGQASQDRVLGLVTGYSF